MVTVPSREPRNAPAAYRAVCRFEVLFSRQYAVHPTSSTMRQPKKQNRRRPFHPLYNPGDENRPPALGRIGHFVFCLIMSIGLLVILIAGGWIATMFFWLSALFALEVVGSFVEDETAVSPSIWVPMAVCLGLVFWAVVLSPTLWAILSILVLVLGLASALFPNISRSPGVVRLVNWLETSADRVINPFRRR